MRTDSQQGCSQVIGECLFRSLVAPVMLDLSLGAWGNDFHGAKNREVNVTFSSLPHGPLRLSVLNQGMSVIWLTFCEPCSSTLPLSWAAEVGGP